MLFWAGFCSAFISLANIGSDALGSCYWTGCQQDTWAVLGCSGVGVETNWQHCDDRSYKFRCCNPTNSHYERVPPGSPSPCRWTECQKHTWAVQGCTLYKEVEKSTRPCPYGEEHYCCKAETHCWWTGCVDSNSCQKYNAEVAFSLPCSGHLRTFQCCSSTAQFQHPIQTHTPFHAQAQQSQMTLQKYPPHVVTHHPEQPNYQHLQQQPTLHNYPAQQLHEEPSLVGAASPQHELESQQQHLADPSESSLIGTGPQPCVPAPQQNLSPDCIHSQASVDPGNDVASPSSKPQSEIMVVGSSGEKQCRWTSCHLDNSPNKGCEDEEHESDSRDCPNGHEYKCCEGDSEEIEEECIWTNCLLDILKVGGCEVLQLEERAKRACQGGHEYWCCPWVNATELTVPQEIDEKPDCCEQDGCEILKSGGFLCNEAQEATVMQESDLKPDCCELGGCEILKSGGFICNEASLSLVPSLEDEVPQQSDTKPDCCEQGGCEILKSGGYLCSETPLAPTTEENPVESDVKPDCCEQGGCEILKSGGILCSEIELASTTEENPVPSDEEPEIWWH